MAEMTQKEKIELTKSLIKSCPRSRKDIKRDLIASLDYAERCGIEINESVLLRRKGNIELHIGCTKGDMLDEAEESHDS